MAENENLRLMAAPGAAGQAQAELSDRLEQQREQLNHLSDKLRQLSQEIIIAQEQERQRIARELRDETEQGLTLLKVSLELLREDLIKVDDNGLSRDMVCERIGQTIFLCEETASKIHRLAHDLHPVALKDLGLKLALEGLCADFSEHTRLLVVYSGSSVPMLCDASQISLYRFAQEGLTNVIKHARAHRVTVSLQHDAHQVMLKIEDDGCGFCQAAVGSQKSVSAMGLSGIQEQLSVLGGSLEIDSRPDQGTRLTAYLPYEMGIEPEQPNLHLFGG